MNRGAYWAGRAIGEGEDQAAAAPPGGALDGADDPAVAFGVGADREEPEPPARTFRESLVVGLFVALAAAWLAVIVSDGAGAVRDGAGWAAAVRGVALGSAPLTLLAMIWLLWQRSGPREVSRYADAARAVRGETLALDTVLGLASRRLEDDRGAVAAEAERLVGLADDASRRIREAGDAMAREIASLDAKARALDEAAGTARVDMGVLLADLPIASGQVTALAEALRGAGLAAHEQAQALQAALEGLAARARDAEEAGAGAANRLAAQAARVASAGEAAAQGIAEAEARMTGGVDAVLARVGQAVERTHAGIVAQGEAIDAMASRAAVRADEIAARTGDLLGQRIAALAGEIEALGAVLAAREGDGEAAIARIRQGLSAVEARFVELDETGRVRTERLGEALGALWAHAEKTIATLHGGGTAATTLINRTETLHAGLRACLAALGEALPAALTRLDERIATSAPAIDHLGARVEDAARAIAGAGDGIDARRATIEALSESLAGRLADAAREAAALEEAVARADAESGRLAGETTPRLVDALVRVRETAGQAAGRAREALSAIVPPSAAALGEAGREAMAAAIAATVEAGVARVSAAGEDAAARAATAAARIGEEVARIAETSASIDARVAAGRAEIAAADRDNLSQRTAQLVDALNAAGVDVARALDAEPGDAAWNAYLKGDRGVFTRRAVRLLDGGDARTVARHYEADDAFRERVNRFVADFEALLRPILAMRDGQALAVVLLSSGIGRLYVALAQGIERLRA